MIRIDGMVADAPTFLESMRQLIEWGFPVDGERVFNREVE